MSFPLLRCSCICMRNNRRRLRSIRNNEFTLKVFYFCASWLRSRHLSIHDSELLLHFYHLTIKKYESDNRGTCDPLWDLVNILRRPSFGIFSIENLNRSVKYEPDRCEYTFDWLLATQIIFVCFFFFLYLVLSIILSTVRIDSVTLASRHEKIHTPKLTIEIHVWWRARTVNEFKSRVFGENRNNHVSIMNFLRVWRYLPFSFLTVCVSHCVLCIYQQQTWLSAVRAGFYTHFHY